MRFRLRENAYHLVVFLPVLSLSVCHRLFVIDRSSHVRRHLQLHNNVNFPESGSHLYY
jgi:hypothetical protein